MDSDGSVKTFGKQLQKADTCVRRDYTNLESIRSFLWEKIKAYANSGSTRKGNIQTGNRLIEFSLEGEF